MMTLRFFTVPVITVIKMPTTYSTNVVISSAPIITGIGIRLPFSRFLPAQYTLVPLASPSG